MKRPLTDTDVARILGEARKYIEQTVNEKRDISEDWVKLILTNGVLVHWLALEQPNFKMVEKFFKYNSSTSYKDMLDFLSANEDGAEELIQRMQLHDMGAMRIHTGN